MREILFRGKDVRGIWHVGLLAHIGNAWYISNKAGIATAYEVIPETVGQYTGLTDKNGEKIFEHDIVRIRGDQNNEDWKRVDYIAQIVFIDGGFCAIDGTIEEYGFRRYGLSRMDFYLEVIGNIHDNPELIGDKENKK